MNIAKAPDGVGRAAAYHTAGLKVQAANTVHGLYCPHGLYRPS